MWLESGCAIPLLTGHIDSLAFAEVVQHATAQVHRVLLTDMRSSGAQEDDQRLGALPLRTIEHILALLPAAVGDTPRERVPSQAGKPDSSLTGADVRMAAASTVAHLSRSLNNRCASHGHPS